MYFKNSFFFIFEIGSYLKQQLKTIYLQSSLYDKKISKKESGSFIYRPTLSILSCLVKYDKPRNKIEELDTSSIWNKKKINNRNYKKLHSFFWLFTIDLKSSNKIVQSVIEKWIKNYIKYHKKNWDIDILSKRVISWISNSKLTYQESTSSYKEQFDHIINKQINHLINEINNSKTVDDKMLGCTAIIMGGLSYNNDRFLNYGQSLLKKIIDSSFDSNYFPKSRSIRQLMFYLKYFVLIREILKESLKEIPEFLNEIIFYLGKSYNLLISHDNSLLFNGNHDSDIKDFNKYLSLYKYKFKNAGNEAGGYVLLENKNSIICMDIGSTPNKKFSDNYQSGVHSFEFIFKGEKLICNSGYFQDYKNKLNLISKSTAAHSTLIIDNKSACSFKNKNIGQSFINSVFKTSDKKIISENNFWSIQSSHDGYLKNYGILHQRILNFYHESFKLKGEDRLLKKNNFKSSPFEIRFHFLPEVKLTKTQDNKTVFIELKNSGWRFFSEDGSITVETGLYFGNKNTFNENQNICISGISQKEDQEIKWEFNKI